MNGGQWPLEKSPFAQIAWPTNGCVALVLDGASIPRIAQRIYEWSVGVVEAECLYASTRWEPVSEFAPWLVWLSSENDAVVRHFLEEGAGKEWGYFLLSEHKPDLLRDYLRQLLVVERVPGCAELLRIAHPELARSIIGEGRIGPAPALPSGVVNRVISPDLVTGTWAIQHPPGKPGFLGQQLAESTEALEATFAAFNRRRDNLCLWELLDQALREWLGGPSIPDAFSKLSQLTQEAEQQHHQSPRGKMRYMLEQYRRDELARIDALKAHTFMDEQ